MEVHLCFKNEKYCHHSKVIVFIVALIVTRIKSIKYSWSKVLMCHLRAIKDHTILRNERDISKQLHCYFFAFSSFIFEIKVVLFTFKKECLVSAVLYKTLKTFFLVNLWLYSEKVVILWFWFNVPSKLTGSKTQL